MTRTKQNVDECWNENTKEFDWDEYQHLCDCADYWDCEDWSRNARTGVCRGWSPGTDDGRPRKEDCR